MKIRLSLLKMPSAFIPLAMSLAALLIVYGHAALFGIVHETDEGAAAHIWQLLMAAQLPFVAYFMIAWVPRQFRQALPVLGLLVLTWLANFAGVYFLT